MALLGLARTATVDLWRSVLTRSHSVFRPEGGGESHSAPPENSSDSKSRERIKGTRALYLVWPSARVLIMRTPSNLVKTRFSVGENLLLLASLSANGLPESFKKFRSEYPHFHYF